MKRHSPGNPISGSLSPLGRFVVRNRRHPVIRKLAGGCRRFLDWYGNLSYDLASNGEGFVLQTISHFEPKVLFDVGANVGDWSCAARRACPSAAIHAFEIAPATFDRLVTQVSNLTGVIPVNLGLADRSDRILLRHYTDYPALTTSTDYPHPYRYSQVWAEVISGDEYASQQQVGHIDLLKIDVEGMEERVLHGFSNMLSRQAIDLVQFEYGRVNILNRFLLRDAYQLFRKHGFLVGKIFPGYVDFRDYNFIDEDFMGPNYLACREDKSDFVEAFMGNKMMASPKAAGNSHLHLGVSTNA